MAYYFVEYNKMIYLGGDIQVFEKIDHHFYLPNGYFYDVMDCFYEKDWSQTPQYKICYCQQCPDRVKWPADMGVPPSLYFYGGMFLFEPNLSGLFERLIRDTYKPIHPVYNLVLPMLWRHPENVELDEVKPWRYTGDEENMQREDIKMVVKKCWDIYNDESLDYRVPVK
ncbi:hypothetical protein MKW94_012453 [Papaver nudicaule]|uniref:Hexosyltransferase n=1 Tax=Papaver nudicaule TaxID=74823 RepID=A0AA41SCR9_PAPNU|nr:hypothetical protein [Papaver nudicaule]